MHLFLKLFHCFGAYLFSQCLSWRTMFSSWYNGNWKSAENLSCGQNKISWKGQNVSCHSLLGWGIFSSRGKKSTKPFLISFQASMFPIGLSCMPLFLIPFYCPHASSIPRSFQTKIFPYLFWFLLGWKVEVNNERWKNKTKTKKQKKNSFLSIVAHFVSLCCHYHRHRQQHPIITITPLSFAPFFAATPTAITTVTSATN